MGDFEYRFKELHGSSLLKVRAGYSRTCTKCGKIGPFNFLS